MNTSSLTYLVWEMWQETCLAWKHSTCVETGKRRNNVTWGRAAPQFGSGRTQHPPCPHIHIDTRPAACAAGSRRRHACANSANLRHIPLLLPRKKVLGVRARGCKMLKMFITPDICAPSTSFTNFFVRRRRGCKWISSLLRRDVVGVLSPASI